VVGGLLMGEGNDHSSRKLRAGPAVRVDPLWEVSHSKAGLGIAHKHTDGTKVTPHRNKGRGG